MKNNSDEFKWGNHILTNAELELLNEGLEDLVYKENTDKLYAFKKIMIARYGEPGKSMKLLLDKRNH